MEHIFIVIYFGISFKGYLNLVTKVHFTILLGAIMRKALIHQKVSSVLNFIKLLRVEPIILLLAIKWGIKATPNTQIIQDKICTHWYNTTAQYCHDLPSNIEEDSLGYHFKSRILTDSSQFGKFCMMLIKTRKFLIRFRLKRSKGIVEFS